MADIKPIRSETDYEAALDRISELMDSEADCPEGDELDVLADLVELYENNHVPMDLPSPVAAIEFRMDQAGLRPADLVPFIGSRAKVSEVLSGKRAITMPMARALHEHLGIPADVLLQEQDVDLDDPWADMQWSRFPVKSMAKLGWIQNRPELEKRAEHVMRDLINRAGGPDAAGAALFRKNDHAHVNAKMTLMRLRRGAGGCLRKPTTTYRRRAMRVAPLLWTS